MQSVVVYSKFSKLRAISVLPSVVMTFAPAQEINPINRLLSLSPRKVILNILAPNVRSHWHRFWWFPVPKTRGTNFVPISGAFGDLAFLVNIMNAEK
jgi:hypothetical protein